jgi:hypothetical protein
MHETLWYSYCCQLELSVSLLSPLHFSCSLCFLSFYPFLFTFRLLFCPQVHRKSSCSWSWGSVSQRRPHRRPRDDFGPITVPATLLSTSFCPATLPPGPPYSRYAELATWYAAHLASPCLTVHNSAVMKPCSLFTGLSQQQTSIIPPLCRLRSTHTYLHTYSSDGRFWPVDLCCAVVRCKSASLRLVSMRSDTILPEQQLRRWGNRIAIISILCASPTCSLLVFFSVSLVSLCRRDKFVA